MLQMSGHCSVRAGHVIAHTAMSLREKTKMAKEDMKWQATGAPEQSGAQELVDKDPLIRCASSGLKPMPPKKSTQRRRRKSKTKKPAKGNNQSKRQAVINKKTSRQSRRSGANVRNHNAESCRSEVCCVRY